MTVKLFYHESAESRFLRGSVDRINPQFSGMPFRTEDVGQFRFLFLELIFKPFFTEVQPFKIV